MVQIGLDPGSAGHLIQGPAGLTQICMHDCCNTSDALTILVVAIEKEHSSCTSLFDLDECRGLEQLLLCKLC